MKVRIKFKILVLVSVKMCCLEFCPDTTPDRINTISFRVQLGKSEMNLVYDFWCNIMIRLHFPLHTRGVHKWDTHLEHPGG